MKITTSSISALASACVLWTGSLVSVQAATYFWDVDPNTALNQNGSGVWTSEAGQPKLWGTSTTAGDHQNVAWENGVGHIATIGATQGYTNNLTGGTITLSENISLARFDKSSQAGLYTISGGVNDYTITLTKGSSVTTTGIANNHETQALILDARVLGTEGFTKSNAGKVVLARNNEISGRVLINASGTVAAASSVLQIGNGGTTGTLGAAYVEFASDGNNATQSVYAFNRSDRVVMTNRLVSSTNAGRLNKGILQQMGTGTLVLDADLTEFTGGFLVSQGRMALGEGNTTGSLGQTSYVEIANGGTFVLDRSDAFVWDRQLRGAGLFQKLGANMVTVLQGAAASTHSGVFQSDGGRVVVGQSEAFSAASTFQFGANGVLDLNGFTQTFKGLQLSANVTGTVVGSGNSHLILTGADWNLGAGLIDNTQVLDMTGLARFTYDSATHRISLGTTGNFARNYLTVKFADTNLIRAREFDLSLIESGLTTGHNRADVQLGRVNEIYTDLSYIGYTKSDVTLQFAPNDGTSTVKVRGTNGTSRMNMIVGRGESGGLTTLGRVDFSGGISDLLFNRLVIGMNHNRETQAANTTGTFVMGAGTLDATQIILGAISNTSTTTTHRGIGNLEIRNGGWVKADQIIYGEKTGTGLGAATGTLSLIQGTLAARTIQHGTVSSIASELIWTGGTLTHLDANTDLSVTGVTLRMGNGSAKTLEVGSGRTVSILSGIQNTATNAATDIFTKTGAGTLVLGGSNTYTGRLSSQQGVVRTSVSNALSGGFLFTGASTLDLGSTSHTITSLNVADGVTGTVTGQKLRVQSSTNFTVQGNEVGHVTKLDLSGLNEFEWIGSTADILWGSINNKANVTSEVHLAKSNTITARTLGLANAVHGDTGGLNRSVVVLGDANVFNLGTLTVGNYKSTAQMGFASTGTQKSLSLYGLTGVGSRTAVNVGINQSGALATDATLDLSGGQVTAMISTLTLGRSDNSGTQTQTATGRFIMNQGLVDATNVYLGELNSNSTATTKFSDAQFILRGSGELRAENVIFGRKSTAGANSQGTVDGVLEIGGGGTVSAKVIEQGAATISRSEIVWKQGTLRNYNDSSDLTIRNVNVGLDGSGERVFHASGSRVISVQSTIFQGGQTLSEVAFRKRGSGLLELHNGSVYHGNTLVEEGTLRVSNFNGSATGFGGVEISAGAQFGGFGIVAPSGNANFVNRGLLAPKLSGEAGPSQMTLDLTGTTGVFRNEGVMAFDLYTHAGDNTAYVGSSDRLYITGNNATNLQLSGSILLGIGANSGLEASTFQEGDRWLLLDWMNSSSTANSVTLSQIDYQGSALGAGLGWELQSLSAGLYAVVVSVPEPSRALLLSSGCFLLSLRRRRK